MAVTRREFEKRFQEQLAGTDLPRPRTNAWVRTGPRDFEVDCLWSAQRLALELDGRATHGTAAGFDSDRVRDRILQVAGWRTVRITWRQLAEEPAAVGRWRTVRITWRQLAEQPAAVVADLRALLAG